VPLGREGRLREVGLLALYLASAASDYMAGQTLHLDGGASIRWARRSGARKFAIDLEPASSPTGPRETTPSDPEDTRCVLYFVISRVDRDAAD